MIILTFIIEAINLTYIKLPELYSLEARSDEKDINRIKTAFSSISNELAVLNYDNAVWDEAYHYIKDRNLNFTQSNFVLDAYESIKLNGIHIYDIHGSTVWGKAYQGKQWQKIDFEPFDKPSDKVLKDVIAPAQKVDQKSNKPISHTGFIVLNKQLLYFAATLINNASLKTKANGTMIFWRFVDAPLLAVLQERSGIKFDLELVQLTNNQPTPQNSKDSNTENSYRTKDGNIFDFYPLMNDTQALKFTYKAPTRLFETHWLNPSAIITALSFSATLLIVYLFIHFIIIRPITQAKKLVNVIIEDNDRSVRFDSNRPDELGTLFNLIDRLLEDISSKEQELVSHNLRLQEISSTDALTNIANRRAFDIYIQNLLATSTKKETSILVCDVDYFKKYNDFYGHAMGDKTLRLIAETLHRNLHADTDFVARYGGEEFVIVLNNTSVAEAESVANNLITSIALLNISHQKSDIADHITISIGSHTFIAADRPEYTSLFNNADKALYLAKSLGRNRACSSTLLDQFKSP